VTADPAKLHPAEHRAYRELYAACRHLIDRWRRLAGALDGAPPLQESLARGASEAERLLDLLGPRTAAYGLYGKPLAQGIGARLADVRNVAADRAGDTGLAVRSAVLDIEHVTTLLLQLAQLARAREDTDLAAFCEEWARRMEAQLVAVREAAADLGRDPERTAAPLDHSLLNRAAHGAGWVFGAFGEAFDRAVGRRRG